MKLSISLVLVLSGCLSYAQGSLKKYLEVGDPADFKELIGWAMDPRHSEEIKTNPDLVRKFINQAADKWNTVTDDDVIAWTNCMNHFVTLGIPLNGKNEEEEVKSLMYYTSPMNIGFTDSITTLHKLHTAVLSLGGKTDAIIDGSTYLSQVLLSESKNSELFKSYLTNFKTWSSERKRDWLFAVVMSEEAPDDEETSMLLNLLLSHKAFDVNVRSKNEKTSLFDEVVRIGKFTTASTLLDHSFNVNQRCFACDGQTALHNVVMNQEFNEDEQTKDLLLKMLKNGGDADLRDLKGFTAIHYAIKLKCEMAFRAFMDEEVTFNYQLGTLKGRSYYTFFVDEWNDEDYLEILMNKTGLKPPPTKKEIQKSKEEKKEEEKAAKKKKKN
jgi:ankyrin repeat protein